MASFLYGLQLNLWRFAQWQCLRSVVLHRDAICHDGPAIYAVTHLSHLEPVIVSALVKRQIHWFVRTEFYRRRWSRVFLASVDAIRINRSGRPIAAIRRSIELLGRGRMVGIFPEGGVAQGAASVLRGGPLKHGVCVIARRAKVPVIPVVVLGTDKLNRVAPWLPAKRGKVWLSFGSPIHPREDLHPRQSRYEMAERLAMTFRELFHELMEKAGLDDSIAP